MLRKQLEQRLQSLKSEFEEGQKMLADLKTRQANLQNTLLRISGAIQVLEEELATANSDENGKLSDTSETQIEVLAES